MELPVPITVGGHPALDLLNTVAAPHGEVIEFLADGAALLRWLVLTGGIGAADARDLRQRFSSGELDAVARRAVTLREWLRPILGRSASRVAASLSNVERQRLNAILARGSGFQRLDRSGRGYVASRVRRWMKPDDLLVPIAESIADFVCAADFRLTRKCGNPACTLWFLDRTKAHRRRWCTMQICGNRAKIAAYRRRSARRKRDRDR